MTEAQEIVHRLEHNRERLLLKRAQLVEQSERLAYDLIVNDSVAAEARLAELSDQVESLERDLALAHLAINEARRRAETRSCETVMAELGLGGEPS
jgi:hypothetical protein